MNLIFVGPQGSGKGTQAHIISDRLGIAHISTGDLVRSAEGAIKKEIDSYINKGNLVPDELIIRMLKERLFQTDCDEGFILDGFPRNLAQAKELDEFADIDKVFEINISDKESIKRVLGRRSCKTCGAIYNLNTSPKPKKEGFCDKCGASLYRREDDNEEALKKRLEIYHKDTKKILEHYKSVKINGEQGIEKVSEDILRALE